MTSDDLITALLDEIRLGRLRAEEVLAYLAYAHHEDTKRLVAAREEGAAVGKIGGRAYLLRDRVEDALHS